MKYFYMQNESDQLGPFEIDELKTKEINKDTPIWHDGLSDLRIRRLHQLFNIIYIIIL
jgi:hypothetical protein